MTGKKVDPVTGEMVVKDAVTAALAVPERKGDAISAYLTTETDKTDVASGDVHKAIVEEIMSKTTLDDILATDEPEPLSSYVGRVIKILEFKANDSEFQEGPPVYFVIKVIDEETGEKRTISTSEQNVMAQLLACERNNLFPFRCRPRNSSRMNKFNRYMIRLGRVED